MLYYVLLILWIAFPALAKFVNYRLKHRLHCTLLLLIVCFICYLIFVAAAYEEVNYNYKNLDQYDLNGDGQINGTEMTPQAQQAIDNFTNDAWESFIPILGIPINAIWVIFNFIIFYFCEYICRMISKWGKSPENIISEN